MDKITTPAEALRNHGPIDPVRAEKAAYDIALEAVVVALHRAFDEDGELKFQTQLAEHYQKSALRIAEMKR